MYIYSFLFSNRCFHNCISNVMCELFLRTDTGQYLLRTFQRAIIVIIAWMPATRASLIALLTSYLSYIVVLLNHRIRLSIFVNCPQRLLWPNLRILLYKLNDQLCITPNQNGNWSRFDIFMEYVVDNMSWYIVFSRVVLMAAVCFATKIRICRQLTQYLWYQYCELLVYAICYFV